MPHSLNDETPARGIFALFKGENGSGKSVAALSFPKPYVFDHDRKMPAIAQKHQGLKHIKKQDIHWDTYQDVFGIGDKLKELYDYFPYESQAKADEAGFSGSNECPYETLIGDTITGCSYTCIKTVDDVKGQNILDMLQNIKVSKKGAKTIELRSYDTYNGEDSFLKYYIDTLKFLWARPGNPKNVIICAHVIVSEQSGPPGTSIKTVTRRIVTAGNKIAAYIPAQFDEVYQFATDQGSAFDGNSQVKHLCYTQGVGDDFAKTSYNLPSCIDFTNKSLFDLISDKVDIGREKTL
jgi:hypothetical protein